MEEVCRGRLLYIALRPPPRNSKPRTDQAYRRRYLSTLHFFFVPPCIGLASQSEIAQTCRLLSGPPFALMWNRLPHESALYGQESFQERADRLYTRCHREGWMPVLQLESGLSRSRE